METSDRPCPGLDKAHGFLHNIQLKLTKSKDEFLKEDSANNKKDKKTRRLPARQLYCIPAKRLGTDEETCRKLCVNNVKPSPKKDNVQKSSMDEVVRPAKSRQPPGDEVEQSPKKINVRRLQKDKIEKPPICPQRSEEVQQSPNKENDLEVSRSSSEETEILTPAKKPSSKYNHAVDEVRKRVIFDLEMNTEENSYETVQVSMPVLFNSDGSGDAVTIADSILLEYRQTDSSNEKCIIGDSCLISQALSDPHLMADQSLRRVAMTIAKTCLTSEISSIRMRLVAMVIILRENLHVQKSLSEPESRFIPILLEACNSNLDENCTPSPSSLRQFLSFTSVLYCCDVLHDCVGIAWANLLLRLLTDFLKFIKTSAEAENLFSILKNTGAQLQKDSPSGMREFLKCVEDVFLLNSVDNQTKDILLGIYENTAGGWKGAAD